MYVRTYSSTPSVKLDIISVPDQKRLSISGGGASKEERERERKKK